MRYCKNCGAPLKWNEGRFSKKCSYCYWWWPNPLMQNRKRTRERDDLE